MTAAELLIVAQAYSNAIGAPLSTVGKLAASNYKLFTRLAEGHSCTSRSLDLASTWFYDNWPRGLAWPPTVPRRPRRRCAA
jgi:hypothetical protein